MQQNTKEILLRSATRWHEKGERSNKYFYKVIRGRQHKQTIQALRSVTTGELLSSTTDILKETHRFYTDLYQPTPVDDEAIPQLLNSIPENVH